MKLLLCILDGVGIRDEVKGNAVYEANMPNFKHLLNEYPNCLLEASGTLVGLPKGQMGNSEVGHTNIGAGRVVYQPLELINQKIKNKEFFKNQNLLEVINYVKTNNSKLHLMGLLSDGGIHSHINHLFALLEMCKKEGIKDVCLHVYLDGRDTLPKEGLKYLKELNDKIKKIGIGRICTISGRYYAMDRDNNYDRLEKAYDAIVNGKGEKYSTYEEAIKANLDKDIYDEFTVPCVIDEGKIENKDGVVFFNFRPDRLREMGLALTNKSFDKFKAKKLDIKLVTMMPVDSEVVNTTAFELPKLDNTFGEYISKCGLTQLRIAETEKYAHVTYFFDGGVERKLKGARRKLIASPKVATYDLKPEMSAYKITQSLVKQLKSYDVAILNFANGDMVGHTGKMDATIKALEVIDECIGKLYKKVTELGGIMAITADHGNSDYMVDDKGNEVTSHSTSKVPFVITKEDIRLRDGKLADIAPTLLTLLDLPVPAEMTGDILINAKVKKKMGKIEKILRIISIIFILCSVFYYIGRFGYYYYNSHKLIKYKDMNIVEKLDTYELPECNNNKCFKGDVDNNYVYFNGILWRIISYDENKIRLISNDSLVNLNYDNINKWLDVFRKNLDADDYVTNVSLLTKEEYENSLTETTYLNTNNYWWIENNYLTKENEMKEKDDNHYGVRPVIDVKTNAVIESGNGSMNGAFRIKSDTPYNLSDVRPGSYVMFSDYIWRVVKVDDHGVKLVFSNLLDDHVYSNTNQIFNPDDEGSIAHYLNTEFYNSLDNKELILKTTWWINRYGEDNNYNYSDKIRSVDAYVGLLNIEDMFINNQYNYALLTEGDKDFTYKVNPYNRLYLDFKSSHRKVRPVIYLSGDLFVTDGSGVSTRPYQIGE